MLVNFTDLQNHLTTREESGEIARELGMLPARQHNPGRRALPHWHVAYAHSSNSSPVERG